MSTLIYPPATQSEVTTQQTATLERELKWLLNSVQEALEQLKAGLEDCSALLSPSSVTLVLSSHRTESLKGFVTLSGARVLKGDINLRMPSLPPAIARRGGRISLSTQAMAPTIVVGQLTAVRGLINSCLDVVDATRWTGQADHEGFISGQMRLLHENIRDARSALVGGADVCRAWYEEPVDPKAFDPPLPGTLAFNLSIVEAALVLNVRTLEALPGSSDGTATPASNNTTGSFSGFGLRDRLVQALRGERTSTHDESDETFVYHGKAVRVVDKVMVESQHPSLMAIMAKLTALDHTVALSRRALDVLMNADESEP